MGSALRGRRVGPWVRGSQHHRGHGWPPRSPWCSSGCFLGAQRRHPAAVPRPARRHLLRPLCDRDRGAPAHADRAEWWIVLLAASAADFLPHRGGGASVSFVLLDGGGESPARGAGGRGPAALRLARRPARTRCARWSPTWCSRCSSVPALAALGGAALVVGTARRPRSGSPGSSGRSRTRSPGSPCCPLLAIDVRRVRDRLPAVRPPRRRGRAAGRLSPARRRRRRARLRRTDRLDTPPGPPLLGAAVPAVGGGPLRPARDQRRAAGGDRAVDLGRDRQRGPFAAQSPAENLLELQLFLLAVSVPLLLLSALFTQQRRTAAALTESRRQYQSVVEDQTEMICRFRPDGTLHLRQPRLLRGLRAGAGELHRRQHLGAGPGRCSPHARRAGGASRPRLAGRDPRAERRAGGGQRALAAVARARPLRRARGGRRVSVGRPGHHRPQARRGRAARAGGAEIGRGGAARGRSPQGRVPGHAGPRAAQPAGAHRHRAGDPAQGAARRRRRRPGPATPSGGSCAT